MKTIPLSNRFFYHALNKQGALTIKNDLVLYHSLLHKAYKLLTFKNQGINWEFESFQPEPDLHHWKMVCFEAG